MGSLTQEVTKLDKLYKETPCIRSPELSQIAGCNIFLKLENLQPSGSFKSRGVGTLMARAISTSASGRVHFYCSSGGNAGLACAEAARTLRQPCDIFVWSLTPDHVLDKLTALGATPHRGGVGWPEADAFCRAAAQADPVGIYVPPFDHPFIWDGNATLIDELAALEFPCDHRGGSSVDGVVCSVGGGGLLNGILEGIERNYDTKRAPVMHLSPATHHSHTPSDFVRRCPAVLALETVGADSLAASIRNDAHVTLPAVTSVATSLGAPRVSEATFRWAKSCRTPTLSLPPSAGFSSESSSGSNIIFPPPVKNTDKIRLVSAVLPDADAVSACVRFLDDARILVEPACGVAIAGVYYGASRGAPLLRAAFLPDADDARWARANIVIVVCGGSNMSLEMLTKYRATFGV